MLSCCSISTTRHPHRINHGIIAAKEYRAADAEDNVGLNDQNRDGQDHGWRYQVRENPLFKSKNADDAKTNERSGSLFQGAFEGFVRTKISVETSWDEQDATSRYAYAEPDMEDGYAPGVYRSGTWFERCGLESARVVEPYDWRHPYQHLVKRKR